MRHAATTFVTIAFLVLTTALPSNAAELLRGGKPPRVYAGAYTSPRAPSHRAKTSSSFGSEAPEPAASDSKTALERRAPEAPPVVDVASPAAHLLVGLFATTVQLGVYGGCLALGGEPSECIVNADNAGRLAVGRETVR